VREVPIDATDPALDRLVQSYLDLKWHLDPVEATVAGVSAHDQRFGQYGNAEVDQHIAALKSIAGSLEELSLESLDDEIDRTAVLNDLRTIVHRFGAEQPHRRNPAFWIRHVIEGLYLLLARPSGQHGDRARSAMPRLAAVPGFLAEAEGTLTAFPAPFVQTALGSIDGALRLIDRVAAETSAANDGTLPAVQTAAKTALVSFGRFLENQAREHADAFAIGEDAFNFRLRYEHGIAKTAGELWTWGLEAAANAVRTVETRAHAIDASVPWPDLLDRLREQHPSADDLVSAYGEAMDRAERFVRERNLVSVPEGAVRVIETPSFLTPLIPFAAYLPPGAFDVDQIGCFFVSLPGAEHVGHDGRQMLRDHCIHQLAERALHEVYPGHHLHFVTAHAQFRTARRVIGSAISHEGWAHYCELMMQEAGFFESEEETLFHEVASLARVLRVVLDVGLHTQGMTYDGAVDSLVNTIHIDRRHAEAEVRRYCATPTVQLCYAIGRSEILGLRAAYGVSHGSSEGLRDFHDALLAFGGLPVSLAGWGMGLLG